MGDVMAEKIETAAWLAERWRTGPGAYPQASIVESWHDAARAALARTAPGEGS